MAVSTRKLPFSGQILKRDLLSELHTSYLLIYQECFTGHLYRRRVPINQDSVIKMTRCELERSRSEL